MHSIEKVFHGVNSSVKSNINIHHMKKHLHTCYMNLLQEVSFLNNFKHYTISYQINVCNLIGCPEQLHLKYLHMKITVSTITKFTK